MLGIERAVRTVGTVRAVAAVALLASVAACHKWSVTSFPTPESLYVASLSAYRHGRYVDALEGFRKLGYDLPPGDSLRSRVKYWSAQCDFGTGDYVTAAREFRNIADDDPDDPLAADALLRAGDAHRELWRRPELDPSEGQTALATYQELESRYPDAPAARIAVARVRELNDWFAQKAFENGDFYLRRGAYDSAILYFRAVIAQYPTAAVVPDAFVRLVRAYKALDYKEEMEETCQTVRQYYGGRRDVRELCGPRPAGR